MKINDIIPKENGNTSIRLLDSKSIPREVPLTQYPEKLMDYLEIHPLKNNKEAPLWFSQKNKNKPLTQDRIEKKFRKMNENLTLNPKLSLKSFRKTRATIMFNQPKRFNDKKIGDFSDGQNNTWH